MGGISRSRLQFDPAGYAVFCGSVSFANNGGFASIRCSHTDLAAPGAIAFLLDVLGDGKCYKFNLRTDNAFDGINYQCRLQPTAGTWSTCRLASADFLPTWRGRSVADAPPLDPAQLHQVGFMIADRQEGDFSLAIRGITADIRKG